MALLRVYMDLTGASEVKARSVFMYVCCRECDEVSVAGADWESGTMRAEEATTLSWLQEYEKQKDWLRIQVAIQEQFIRNCVTQMQR